MVFGWQMTTAQAGSHPAMVFKDSKVRFCVLYKGIRLGYKIQSLFLLPNEKVTLTVVDANWKHSYQFEAPEGAGHQLTEREWAWTAPAQPGVYHGSIRKLDGQDAMDLNLIVMIPFDQVVKGQLNGYPIGLYPPASASNHPAPPRGFIEVRPSLETLPMSPHFVLSQFVCRERASFPKYTVIDERLLIKLELLINRLNLKGYACRTLVVSSAFRTPYYNQKSGFSLYSRHCWGQAADILVDRNGDGMMDDLNRDGRQNKQDSMVLKTLILDIEQEIRNANKIGGIGLYDDTDKHGPFVHMDVRGTHAQW